MEQDQLSLRELEESVDFWAEQERNIRGGSVCNDLVKRRACLIGHWMFLWIAKGSQCKQEDLRERRSKDNIGQG